MNSFHDIMVMRTRVVQILRSIFAYLLSGILAIFVGIPLALVLLVAPQSWIQHRSPVYWLLDFLYRGLTLALLVPRKWYGTDRIPREPAIVVAKHQSSLDIPVVGALMQRAPHLWYAMAYYARHPIFGLFLGRLGISVDVAKAGASAKSLLQGMRLLSEDPRHVIIFPEGGRYTDGSIHSFFRGFATLARQTGRPVVPIYMPHNGAIFGPDAYLASYYPMIAQVGETFYLHEDETDEQFVERVRNWFIQQAETWT